MLIFTVASYFFLWWMYAIKLPGLRRELERQQRVLDDFIASFTESASVRYGRAIS